MDKEKPKGQDVLGLEPVSKGIGTLIEDASELLKRICMPAAEEFGLLFQDTIKYWRTKNLVNITVKTKKLIAKQHSGINLRATPRIVYSIIEKGSLIDDDTIQEMWAGLLASSCTKDGNDESNLIFINLLSQLTSSEVKILNYSCGNAEKRMTIHGLVYANQLLISLKDLREISGVGSIHILDRELDHLRSLGLANCGFPMVSKETPNINLMPSDLTSKTSEDVNVYLTPSALALNMYIRCKGSLHTPVEYFDLKK